MAKPTDDPVWNTDATNRTEPDPSQQASGWTLNQKPPSSWFNWWMWLVYSWLIWLRDLVVGAKWVDVGAGFGSLTRMTLEPTDSYWFGDFTAPNVCATLVYLRVPDGTKIDGVRMRHYGTGTNTAQITLYQRAIGGGPIGTTIFQGASGAGGEPATSPASWQTMTKTGAAHTINTSNGTYYVLIALFNEPNVRIMSVGYRIADPT